MAPSQSQETPLYRELANELREAIVSGELAAGAVLPTDAELAERHGVSRNTVRLAYGLLASEGLITPGGGRSGRRVRDRRKLVFHASASESMDRADERQVTGTDAWVTDVAEAGREASQTIAPAIVKAPADIAAWLELPEGTPVVVRLRVRMVDGEPHNLADTYYPMDLALNTPIMYPDDIPQGVIALMREMGHIQVRYIDDLSWRMPTPDETQKLQISVGVPVLLQTRTGYTTERPVKVTRTTWPGDRSRIRYELPA